MRKFINLVESLLNEYRPPDGMRGFHGTSVKFAPSILKNGFKADPEFRAYDGAHTAYYGTYFSDTFTVALYRGHVTAEKYGLPTVVFICEITEPVAGDEDAVVDFVDQEMWEAVGDLVDDFDMERYKTDEDYREEMSEYIDTSFQQKFDEPTPREFYELVLHCETNGNAFDDEARRLIDQITQQIGPVTGANGNHQAMSFRYPNDMATEKILAVVECHYPPEGDLDPSYLPANFTYKVIYGTLPPDVANELVSR